MDGDYDTEEHHLLSKSEQTSSGQKNHLPPTPPIAKARFMKHQHRLSCDRLTSSTSQLDSSIENTPEHVLAQKRRKESTDSGLASNGPIKRQSTDSDVASRNCPRTDSEHSSQGDGVIDSGSREIQFDYPSSNQADQYSTGHRKTFPVHPVTNLSIQQRNSANEKYLSTASDRAADIEVSTIMRIPGNPEPSWIADDQRREYDLNSHQPTFLNNGAMSLSSHPTSNGHLPASHRKIDVASILRQRKRHNECLRKERCPSADNLNPRPSQYGVRSSYDDAMLHLGSNNYCEIAPDVGTLLLSSREQPSSINSLSEVPPASRGISSSDTRQSSIRYEPVQTDHPYNPPSPGPHTNLRNISRSSRCLDEAESDPDDVNIREEEMPLNSQHRDPSPSSDHSSHHHLRGGPGCVHRANPDRLHNPIPGAGTSYKEQRHHTGMPRIGTKFVPIQSSHSSSYLPSSSMHNQQNHSVMAAHVAPSGLPDGDFFPVVTTALKVAHEEDDSEMWSYSRGTEADRSQFSGYPANPHPTRSTPADPNNSTTARFMNKQPAYGGRPHLDPALRHRNRNSRSYNGTFKSLKKQCWGGCSWKVAAITFLVLSIILLFAFAVVFIVNPFAPSAPSVTDNEEKQCLTSSDSSTTSTALVTTDTSSAHLQLRRSVAFSVAPSSFQWMQIYVEEPTHMKFNFTVSADALFAVYGRMGLRPSHTKFDFFEKIDGSTLPTTSTSFIAFTTTSNRQSRKKRSVASGAKVQTEFLEYLAAGTWHLALFNDQENEDTFELTTSLSRGLSLCPNSCTNNGECQNGICKCFHGFQGNDCSKVSCAVTCRGNGVYAQGSCVCFSGWKGMDCGTPSDRCIDPQCGGHGECSSDGECICEKGFKGEVCSEVDCFDPSCSGHGICVEGSCRCDRGWMGGMCSEKDMVCLSNCGGHGTFDPFTKNCICEPGWSGIDCSSAKCRPTCELDHGVCVDGQCRCREGWMGAACDQRQCPARCEEHGSCVSGMCICEAGWNGNLCTFDGCPKDCSGHGDCVSDPQGEWYCSCNSGWKGSGCSIIVEVNCGDGKDNDMDTLIDCQDPDCCSHRSCSRTTKCRGGLDPAHEVAGNQARHGTPATASFFDRVKFLIHRNGVQANADSRVFVPRQASIVRGRVLTSDGSPLIGVNVQVRDRPSYGSTKTRADGWYDLMVNGGGSVVLKFQRPSFLATTNHVFVPWNEFVVAPSVTMKTPQEPTAEPQGLNESCDLSLFSPPSASILVTSVRAYTAAECAEKGSIVPEIQAVREAVTLPSTKASLVYLSIRSSGYKSILEVSLVKGDKPLTLREVHLKITVQGKPFEKKFEALSDLSYTFEWSREDAYGQSVYGSAKTEVKVGYLYESCSQILWKKLATTLQGHDPSLEKSIAFWSLDLHHTYHPDKGVVYLGGGGEMRLLEQPPMISTVLGDGQSRHVTCERCDGPGTKSRLLSPVALTSDPQGNVYVGDHDFIRKLDTSGNVSSLFSTRNPPTKYYMAVSPTESGLLYFSDPSQKKIFRLRRMNLPKNRHSRELTSNVEAVAGSGASCYPLQEAMCGDGGLATAARLTAPKGLAINAFGQLYFVDGSRIRTVDPNNGTITTFTGSLSSTGTRPLQCSGSMSVDQLELNYPTDLAINPRDGSLFVLDQEVVIKIDLNTRHASLVAGVPPHCARKVAKDPDERDSRKVHLVSPTSMTVSVADGALYVAETDQKFVHRIRRIDPYSFRIATVAGTDSTCDCATQECRCFGGDGDFARSASLHNPISITATPDGCVYIADQLNLRLRKIWHSLPEKSNNQYQISDPDTNQLYVFDVNGRHVATKNVITNTFLYRFSYANDGLLAAATDVNDNSLRIEYTSRRIPQRLILPNSDVIGLTVGHGRSLTQISQGSSPIASFTYHDDDTALIRSSIRGRFATTFYVYDALGRLISVTSSTGSVMSLHASANSTSQTLTMKTMATSAGGEQNGPIGIGRRDVIITTEPGYLCDVITTIEGAMRTVYKRWTDNSISVHYLDNSELILETKPHPVLGLTTPSLAKRTIQLPSDPIESKIEWKTRKEAENGYSLGQVLLGRRMRVNDRNILSLDFSQGMMIEKIYDDHTKFMLRVQYNDRGLPYLWMPNGRIIPVNVTYDTRGHAVTWQRGGESEDVVYDRKGNPQRRQFPDGSVWRYTYGEKMSSVTLTGQYDFSYDENNNLQRVTLPSGLSYNINKMFSVGFIRTAISGPDGATIYIQDENDIGNILQTNYPGEERKVVYRYDVHGHVTEILHDSMMTKMLRDPRSGELISLATDDCTLRFHRNGPLVQRHLITSTGNGGLMATFDYKHDINLRLRSLEVRVNDTRLPIENFTYNDVSGKLTTFGPYRIIDMSSNIYAIGDEDFTLSKQFDNSGRLTATSVEAYGLPLFRLSVKYSAGGKMSQQEAIFELISNVSNYAYHYDEMGSLVRVDQDDQTRWRYAYGNDEQLVMIENDRTRTTLRYDSQGRLKSMGDLSYVYDRDGFLQQRGQDVFEYNSMGNLMKAYRDNRFELTYGYDGYGRLSTRVDVPRNHVLRYLYANIQQPEVLTHIYNITSGVLITLRYDVEGHLFAINHSDGVAWSVVCDHAGSPIAVLDRTTTVIKRIKYSPFGTVEFDSNPDIVLHIGFRGGIYDVDTKLVHFHDRSVLSPSLRPEISSSKPLGTGFSTEEKSTKLFDGVDYDPMTGQFTSSGVKSLPMLDDSLLPLRLYQVTDPINLHPTYNHMTDTKSWLNALGFKLQNVAPDPHIASRQKDKSSAECQLSRHLSAYMNMQTSTPSVLVPESYTNHIAGNAMLAQGLIISIDRGQVSTQVTDTATDDVKRFSSVVSGSQVLIGRNADSSMAPMSLTQEGKPALYVTKPASAFAKDKQTMQIPNGQQKNLRSVPGHGSDVSSSLISLGLHENKMRAESGFGVIVIFYVSDGSDVQIYDVEFTSVENERQNVMNNAKASAENLAWLREKRKIQSGLKTRWTRAQQQEILSYGRVHDYTIKQTWNADIYPEFSDSGRSTEFVRKT